MSVLSVGGLHDGQDGLNDKLCIQGGNPVLVDGLRANLAGIGLYAGMVDLRHELDLGGLEGVVVREIEVDGELASNEGSTIGAVNLDVPDSDVVFSGLNDHSWDRCTCQITQFLVSEQKTLENKSYFSWTALCLSLR